ncbi:zinc finger-containing ubiquitin peptidase 1 isoform X1 [Alosa sapidissima]|uniref:zinc finger-containing ubiquitin peptidase 1 isoform X1 n=1 Tax=Alosa sapidissima TaxID=34773 RepID=UPI001C097F87|nr:zinc finger-containing ubiquitin peptidase 1 isoform X1 [Alosa sapidissima]XP_041963870.1 zinc finger-containing ubiquitin peptidase 1 isoform X1 [Alosa sapidissima]XP_041963871.1 zinc finger-containing ubiquitin peptidase 1 isoform X1 [Alosa sapidissima]XP_041963872.1 zinc finger-containing ubiquitin peptidase 1 isoform X1 [Alosa sapidissima]
MPICEICSEDIASEADMKTHLLLSHLENEMHCPFCSLSGVSYDELSFHINTAHVETTNTPSVKARVAHCVPAWTNDREKPRTVTRKEGHWAESLPPGTLSSQTPVPVAESSTDAAVGSVCGTNSATHSPEGRTHSKNTKDRQESLEAHVAIKQKRLSSPRKEKLFPCPMCSLVCQDCFILQEHVELHLQESAMNEGATTDREASSSSTTPTTCYTNTSGVKQYECPLCSLPFPDAFSLQEHVELHLDNDTDAARGAESSSDLTLARQLQKEEEEQRKWQEAKREAEEFKKLQKQFGMDGSGGYRKQIERNMERAVSRGNMVPAEFHIKRAELMESLATGVDDGKTRTPGLMGALYDYFRREPRDTVHVWLCGETDHYSSSEGDKGWGCGYRNFQMLLSSLHKQEPYNNILSDVPIPNIPRVQALIEEAWKQGVDPAGAAHFNHRLQGTRAWVGSTEIYSLFTSLSVNARVVDFHKPTGQGGTHPRLFDWVKQYFSQSTTQNGRLPPRVVQTSLPPIYLQHQGHSRSVVGLEQKRNGSLCLLLFDPGCPPSEMARLLERDSAAVSAVVRRMRKFPSHLKHQQYQVLVVEGLLTPEQKQRQIVNSRTFRADRIP